MGRGLMNGPTFEEYGNFSSSGTSVTFQAIGQAATTFEYCVQGSTLKIRFAGQTKTVVETLTK